MIIYTDGSSTGGNPGNAKARFVVEGSETVMTQDLGFHSNNYAELFGLLMAVKHIAYMQESLPKDEHHTIYSDSRIALGWILKNPKTALEHDALLRIIDQLKRLIMDINKPDDENKPPKDLIKFKHWSTRLNGEIPADFGNKRPKKKNL